MDVGGSLENLSVFVRKVHDERMDGANTYSIIKAHNNQSLLCIGNECWTIETPCTPCYESSLQARLSVHYSNPLTQFLVYPMDPYQDW